MSNKTNIEEGINILERYLKQQDRTIVPEYRFKFLKAIENILADRETTKEDYKILENNYQMLSEDVSNIAKELDLEEDATIDEIIIKIRILKSKRINMFEQLDYIDRSNKYDSLVEKIEKNIEDWDKSIKWNNADDRFYAIKILQKLLDTD